MIKVDSGVSDLQEGGMDLYSSVYTERWVLGVMQYRRVGVGCNAIRDIGWKYSVRLLFWQEVKEVV